MNVEEKLSSVPSKPGVYLMRDHERRIIYIGKAGSLKKRLSDWFRASANLEPRLEGMIASVSDVEYIQTQNEQDALILENNLIKYFHPSYNIQWRDDKSYPHLKLTLAEPFPRLLFTRKIRHDGSRYFGPYVSARSLRQMLRTIQRVFPLVKCTPGQFRMVANSGKSTSCIYYNMGQCLAPCTGNITKDEYHKIVDHVIMFLSGQTEELLSVLKDEMNTASRELNYEHAKLIKQQIEAIERIAAKVHLRKIGEKELELLKREKNKSAQAMAEMIALGRALHLIKKPERIEAYDISNISGQYPVGSRVVFLTGQPAPELYRKYRIKTVAGANDVAMMKEIIRRRIKHIQNGEEPAPDLIIVDGGRGQLNAAQEAVEEAGVQDIPLAAIAKREEIIYTPDGETGIRLPRTSPALHLVQRIRDEAHRFAVSYHRRLRQHTK